MFRWARISFVVVMLCTALSADGTFEPHITDITVFKDGHALVLAQDQAQVTDGWCRTQEVPVPVLGTFWVYVDHPDSQVDFVKAGFVDSLEQRPCLTFDEMVQANQGKGAIIVENANTIHEGKIMGILRHERDEEEIVPLNHQGYRNTSIQPPGQGGPSQLASFVMLETEAGLELIQRTHIRGITLTDDDPVTRYAEEKRVREISLHVEGVESDEVSVGMVYLQKGFRWIPDYRLELLDEGKAKITLQATLVNEIADMDNVNLRMVVGVPSFVMKDKLSPMALRDIGLKLGSYFPSAKPNGSGQVDYLSNAMMSQSMGMAREERAGSGGGSSGTTSPADGQTEDLYVYHKSGITLKKGERAVVTLYEAVIPYSDVYTWDIAPLPPREIWNHFGNRLQQQLASAMKSSQAMHELRLENKSDVPWTTGPALIFKDQLPLGQQLVTYTSINNTLDLPVTVATDLNTKKVETEVKRDTNVVINRDSYTHIFVKGTLSITNYKDQAVATEITRNLFGLVTSASHGGKITQKSVTDDTSVPDGPYPWYRWNWPHWWYRVNAIAEVTWELNIPAGETVAVEYEYDYYYRH